MMTLQEALNKLKKLKFPTTTEKKSLFDVAGHILAEDIIASNNMPPFDKAAVDGFACRQEDIQHDLSVLETISAGDVPKLKIAPGTCTKIMTGAVVPEGANCILMVEEVEILEAQKIRFTGKNTKSNICQLGEDVKTGDKLLSKGDILSPQALAIAASNGNSVLEIFHAPKVALFTTGSELVEPETPASGAKIHNSNPYNLIAQINSTKSQGEYLGIVDDKKDEITKKISQAFEGVDILIITGGVSMGDRDFLPDVLQELKFDIVFRKLAIQPGKPVVFAAKNGKYCFALSGNPVSSFLQFEILVRPFIYFYMNHDYQLPLIRIPLFEKKSRQKADRHLFFPVRIENGYAKTIEFHGSAHISGLLYARGFAMMPIEMKEISSGNEIDVLLIP